MKMYKRDEDTGEIIAADCELDQRASMKLAGWSQQNPADDGGEELSPKQKIAAAKAKAKE